jgi:hypothetical protein
MAPLRVVYQSLQLDVFAAFHGTPGTPGIIVVLRGGDAERRHQDHQEETMSDAHVGEHERGD